jgi:hypothetical protein
MCTIYVSVIFHNYLIVINSEPHIKRDKFLYLKTPTVVSRHDVQCIYSLDMLEHSKYRRTIRIFPHCQIICSHLLVASLYSLLSCPMSLAKLFRIYLNSYVFLSPPSDNTKKVQRFSHHPPKTRAIFVIFGMRFIQNPIYMVEAKDEISKSDIIKR